MTMFNLTLLLLVNYDVNFFYLEWEKFKILYLKVIFLKLISIKNYELIKKASSTSMAKCCLIQFGIKFIGLNSIN